jgi:hypothetical protein
MHHKDRTYSNQWQGVCRENKSYADGAHPGAAGGNLNGERTTEQERQRSAVGSDKDMDWDMMLETGLVGTIAQRRRKMRVMFNTCPTHDFVRAQWDNEHDNRCSCGERESLEHVVMECTLPRSKNTHDEWCTRSCTKRDMAMKTKRQEPSTSHVAKMLRASMHPCMSLGKMCDYEFKELVPTFGTKKTEARRWLTDGTLLPSMARVC